MKKAGVDIVAKEGIIIGAEGAMKQAPRFWSLGCCGANGETDLGFRSRFFLFERL
jgi:hypothetical protein